MGGRNRRSDRPGECDLFFILLDKILKLGYGLLAGEVFRFHPRDILIQHRPNSCNPERVLLRVKFNDLIAPLTRKNKAVLIRLVPGFSVYCYPLLADGGKNLLNISRSASPISACS